MKTEVTQKQMELIALAFSCIIGDVGWYPAEWDYINHNDETPDLTIGMHNDWWLRRVTYPDSEADLYVQMRQSPERWLNYEGFLLKHMVEPHVQALRMQKLCREIQKTTGIIISLPFSTVDIDKARKNPSLNLPGGKLVPGGRK